MNQPNNPNIMNEQNNLNNNNCVIVIGMSGTGKTTFVQKLTMMYTNVHCINLDPAVKHIGYQPFLDIRHTHDYKKIMDQQKLGPNGAILTALNLFAAQPQNIVNAVAKKIQQTKSGNTFLIDIPGQIQVFTWSASSLILTQALSTLMPVKIVYIIDGVRCSNPNTFLSNLLFAQSIRYRLSQFEFFVLLNKCDASDGDKLMQMMKDYDKFLDELGKEQVYLSTLSKSVIINMSECFEKMRVSKISAKTGFGFSQLLKLLQINLDEV